MVYLNTKHKKSSLQAVILFSTILTWSLSLTMHAESAPLSIVNDLSPDHVLIQGTGVYFVPAAGLTLSKKFDGFSSDTRGIEVIVANIKEPYASISEGFTDEILKTRGVEVKSRGYLNVNGADAALIKALHPDGQNKWAKWILLLDCDGHTLVVNGVFESGDDAAAKDVEKMIKSVLVLSQEYPAHGDTEAGKL